MFFRSVWKWGGVSLGLSMASVPDGQKAACNRECLCSDCGSEGREQVRKAGVGSKSTLDIWWIAMSPDHRGIKALLWLSPVRAVSAVRGDLNMGYGHRWVCSFTIRPHRKNKETPSWHHALVWGKASTDPRDHPNSGFQGWSPWNRASGRGRGNKSHNREEPLALTLFLCLTVCFCNKVPWPKAT